jgi:hypothetical protein
MGTGRFRQGFATATKMGLAAIQFFGEDRSCHRALIYPGSAGTPARPQGGSSCFWWFVLRESGPNHRALRVQETRESDSRQRGRGVTCLAMNVIWRAPAPRWRRNPPVGFIRPCELTLTERPPAGLGWLHEVKHDGFRVLARKQGERSNGLEPPRTEAPSSNRICRSIETSRTGILGVLLVQLRFMAQQVWRECRNNWVKKPYWE